MKTYEITDEQIKEAHNHACTEWKAKIENWFPDAFKSDKEIGKWYWANAEAKNEKTYLACYQGKCSYGFDWTKGWHDKLLTSNTKSPEATDKEVEEALINEAKKRGFVEGITCIPLYCNGADYGNEWNLGKGCLEFSQSENVLRFVRGNNDSLRVFVNGKWAEIIPQQIELSMQQIADKFNVNVENLKIKK